MKNNIKILIDELGRGENVFEKFAVVFESYKLENVYDSSTQQFQNLIDDIERKLQDLSEKINATNEFEENIYSLTISKVKEILSVWLPVFSKKETIEPIKKHFISELIKLSEFIELKNIEKKSIVDIKSAFDNIFILNSELIKNIKDSIYIIDENNFESTNYVIVRISNIIKKNIYNLNFDYLEPKKLKNKSYIKDSEDTIYTGTLKFWIDSKDAKTANTFMFILTNVLTSIENVDLIIIDSGVGSFWQKLVVKVKGWYAKEETKQILKKGLKALETKTLDNIIEPIEKTIAEKEKIKAETKRLMSEEDTKKFNKIKLLKAEAELESIKLANYEKRIEITSKLSEMLKSGLLEIDSDYRIEINNLLLISKENGVVKVGNIDDIDNELDLDE